MLKAGKIQSIAGSAILFKKLFKNCFNPLMPGSDKKLLPPGIKGLSIKNAKI